MEVLNTFQDESRKMLDEIEAGCIVRIDLRGFGPRRRQTQRDKV